MKIKGKFFKEFTFYFHLKKKYINIANVYRRGYIIMGF